MAKCSVCFRHCEIDEGKTGFCGARGNDGGKVIALNYGKITSLALDPIEKKPLNRFMSGSKILSVGSYGCNLRCPFCQNSEISWGREVKRWPYEAEELTPKELADMAYFYKAKGNIGVAYTYNEPLTGYEFVRDCAKLVHEMGMVNVLVTNGCASMEVYNEIIPYIDAMNIDLKGFKDEYYSKLLGGDRRMVMDFIARAVKDCHVELTTLIIPRENDSKEEMEDISSWIASLTDVYDRKEGRDIPLHISRFFPQFHMTDRNATDVDLIYHLKDIAKKNLRYVYTGNC